MPSSDSASSQASADAQQRTVRTSKRRILDPDESSSESSSGDESEGSSRSEEQRYFLDLEAEESNDDSHGSADDADHELSSFPQFLRLPIELRHRIWDFFDPDLREPRRVFKFRLPVRTTPRLCESELLDCQTAPAWTVLSTHQESRRYALGFYPDVLVYGSCNTMRYRRETDVILVAAGWELLLSSNARWQPLQHAMSQVKHMALEVDVEPIDAGIPQSYIDRKLLSLGSSIVPHLDTFYLVSDDNEFRGEDIKWCVTDIACSFRVQTEEEEPGVGEDLDYVFCWPDPTKEEQLGYVRKYIDQTGGGENEDDDTDNRYEDGFEKGVILHNDKVTVYPMIQFSFDRGLLRYNLMKSVNSRPGGWDRNWDPYYDNNMVWNDSDEFSELDEYESEGIDDSPIEDSDGDSDEDSGMVYHGGDSDDGGPDNLSGPVSYMFAGSSRAQSTTMGALAAANFSDFESSESSDRSSDDGVGDDAHPTRLVQPSGRPAVADPDEDSSDKDGAKAPKEPHQPRRTVVLDSDSDDNEIPDEEQIPPKRRKRAVVSDSDDDDEISQLEQPQPSRRRKREVLFDSDDDDEPAKAEEARPLKRARQWALPYFDGDSDEDDDFEKRVPASKQRKRMAVPESDEDSADNDDDSATEAGSADETSGSSEGSSEEEDERPKKKPSLAERLNLFRSQVPAAPSPEPGSDADSDMAQLRNGDYDEPDAHSDDAADMDDMDEASANEAWDEAGGDSEGDSAW